MTHAVDCPTSRCNGRPFGPPLIGNTVGLTVRIDYDSLDSPRSLVALERFRAGGSLTIDGLGLTVDMSEGLKVTVWTAWVLGQAPDGSHEKEIRSGVQRYKTLVERWPGFRSAIADRRPTFELCLDYGNGSICLGRLDNDGSYVSS